MRTLLLPIIVVMIFLMLPATGHAAEVSGDQWGTWSADESPYNVVGEVHVPQESTLVIEPGVVVNFQGHYKLVVDSIATLWAVGTVTDSIVFTAQDTATGWHGIRFLQASASSRISYSRLEHGKATGNPEENQQGGAIYCYNSSPTISHNTISYNFARWAGGGISCYNHDGVIENNSICDNLTDGLGGGVHCDGIGPRIRNNLICDNGADQGGGIFCFRNTVIEGNIIHENFTGPFGRGMGIHVSYLDVTIKNNSICYNECPYGSGYGGGILCSSGTMITGNVICRNFAGGDWYDGSIGGGIYGGWVILENNTIADNDAYYHSAIDIGGDDFESMISNCIIVGSKMITNATVEYCNIEDGWPGVGNIDEKSRFVDPLDGDYRLSARSPCIDAGDPESEVPEGGGDRIDIGALEYFQRFNGLLIFAGVPEVAFTGSSVSWEATVVNPAPYPQTVDTWIDYSGPLSGVTLMNLDRTIPPGEWSGTVVVAIPDSAEEGLYTVKGRIGIYREKIWDSEVFDLEIVDGTKQARIAELLPPGETPPRERPRSRK